MKRISAFLLFLLYPILAITQTAFTVPFVRINPATGGGGGSLAQDTFTGTNGTDLTAHTPDSGASGAWASLLPNGNWQIQSNQAQVTSTGTYFALYGMNYTPSSANYAVTATYEGGVSYSATGIGLRCSGSGINPTGVFVEAAQYYPAGIQLVVWVDGVKVTSTSASTSISVGDILKLSASGTTFTIYKNGTQVWTGTDSYVSQVGQPCLLGQEVGDKWDTFTVTAN